MHFEDEKKREVYENENRTSFIYDGIACVIWKENVELNIENAREALSYQADHYCQGQRLPTLVEMSNISALTPEARTYFQTENPKTSSALALVVSSTISRVIGNLFISIGKSEIPVRLFNSTRDALDWLKSYKK